MWRRREGCRCEYHITRGGQIPLLAILGFMRKHPLDSSSFVVSLLNIVISMAKELYLLVGFNTGGGESGRTVDGDADCLHFSMGVLTISVRLALFDVDVVCWH